MPSTNKSSKSKETPKTVGKILKEARQEQGKSLKEIEIGTRVRGKYLIAIEADKYSELPHDVYTRGFVSSYADFLGLNSKKLIKQYEKERGDQPVELGRKAQELSADPVVSARRLTFAMIAITALAIVSYLFWQFSALTAAPSLEVSEPSKDEVLYGSLIKVKGKVGGGGDVFINDSPILIDANGEFSTSLALQNGVNSIRVTAKSRLGKETTVTRNILANVPSSNESSELPSAVFDGVAVRIQIKDSAATVTVRADGKEVFKGTMLPGTIQVFKGTSLINVSTSNAGATLLTVTNSQAANVSLGSSGAMGQPRNNLEFAKETQFK